MTERNFLGNKNHREFVGFGWQALSSFKSLVVVKVGKQLYFGSDVNYGRTTVRYVNAFTYTTKEQREVMLKEGTALPITKELVAKLGLPKDLKI